MRNIPLFITLGVLTLSLAFPALAKNPQRGGDRSDLPIYRMGGPNGPQQPRDIHGSGSFLKSPREQQDNDTFLRPPREPRASGSLLEPPRGPHGSGSLLRPPRGRSSSGALMNPIVNGTCMATAVTKRDTVISGALQTVATAILKRGTDEATGWNNNDKSAVKQANDVFQSVWKTFDQMRQSAWNQFKHDAAACKTKSGTSTDEPVGSASL